MVRPAFNARLTTSESVCNVGYVNDEVLPGDVGVGDIIALPGADEGLLVTRVRLGQGGFIFSVSAADDPSSESVRQVTLTARTRLQLLGRVPVF
jgi:hypothetical protein